MHIQYNRPPSSHPGPGGNWPSTTGRPSGGGRGNAKERLRGAIPLIQDYR